MGGVYRTGIQKASFEKERLCLTAGARKSKLHAPGRDVLGWKGLDGFILPYWCGAELRSLQGMAPRLISLLQVRRKYRLLSVIKGTTPALDRFLDGLMMAARYLKSYENQGSGDGGRWRWRCGVNTPLSSKFNG